MSSIRIVDPKARTIGPFFGIPKRRAMYLTEKLKPFLDRMKDEKKAFHTLYLVDECNKFCDQPEEVLACVIFFNSACKTINLPTEYGVESHDIKPEDLPPEDMWNLRISDN